MFARYILFKMVEKEDAYYGDSPLSSQSVGYQSKRTKEQKG